MSSLFLPRFACVDTALRICTMATALPMDKNTEIALVNAEVIGFWRSHPLDFNAPATCLVYVPESNSMVTVRWLTQPVYHLSDQRIVRQIHNARTALAGTFMQGFTTGTPVVVSLETQSDLSSLDPDNGYYVRTGSWLRRDGNNSFAMQVEREVSIHPYLQGAMYALQTSSWDSIPTISVNTSNARAELS